MSLTSISNFRIGLFLRIVSNLSDEFIIAVNFNENCQKPEVLHSSMKINNIKKLVIYHMTIELSRIYFSQVKSLKIIKLDKDEIVHLN